MRGHSPNGPPASVGDAKTVADPVSGMKVNSAKTKHHTEHQGTTWFGHYFTGLAVETRTWIELVLTIPVVLWSFGPAGRFSCAACNRYATSAPTCGP